VVATTVNKDTLNRRITVHLSAREGFGERVTNVFMPDLLPKRHASSAARRCRRMGRSPAATGRQQLFP
jgi:hypothetical protein